MEVDKAKERGGKKIAREQKHKVCLLNFPTQLE